MANIIFPDEKKNKIISASITALLMVIVLIICFSFGYQPPDPPIPENGVEVNLGDSDMGIGENSEPSSSVPTPPTPYRESSDNTPVDEQVMTQNNEETTSIAQKDNPKDNTKADNAQPEKPKEPAINKKALFKGSNNKNTTGSQGVTQGIGDQGKPDGNPNSQSFSGQAGNGGSSYNLSGRSVKSLPQPNYSSNDQGKVVVEIWVDPNGNVTRVSAPAKGSTITKANLVEHAKAAARKAKFSTKSDAPEEQKGTITYVYRRAN